MADYLLVHDRGLFDDRLRPVLADVWTRRSFLPFLPLADQLLHAIRQFAARYHVNPDDLLLPRVEALRFDRHLWRALVGEVLLVAALEVPDLPSHLDTLLRLLPAAGPALRGSRDLTFGLATYRPGHAGLNNADDVARLSGYLDSVHPEEWTEADLAGIPDLAEEDRAFELAYAREWFAVLADVYRRAATAGRIIVCESIW